MESGIEKCQLATLLHTHTRRTSLPLLPRSGVGKSARVKKKKTRKEEGGAGGRVARWRLPLNGKKCKDRQSRLPHPATQSPLQ